MREHERIQNVMKSQGNTSAEARPPGSMFPEPPWKILLGLLKTAWYGPDWDLTDEEKEERRRRHEARDAAEAARPIHSIVRVLGSIHDRYTIRVRRGGDEILLFGNPDDSDSEDGVAHAKKAYEFLGEDHPRLVRYLGPLATDHLRFEYLRHGSLASFLSRHRLPSSVALPNKSSHPLAIQLRWILHLTSALSFLHSKQATHRALALDSLWLRKDLSLAVFDLTNSSYGFETAPLSTEQLLLPFPSEAVAGWYWNGSEREEDIVEFGMATDVFELGTVSYIILTGDRNPKWALPTSDPHRSMEQLRAELHPDVSALKDMPALAKFVRKCWALQFRDGIAALEACKELIEAEGIEVTNEHDFELDPSAQQLLGSGGQGSWLGNGSEEYKTGK